MSVSASHNPAAGSQTTGRTGVREALPPSTYAAQHVRGLIQDSDLLEGDRLPSERKLSRTLGVDRATVRRAFDQLRSQGLITTGPRGERLVARAARARSDVMRKSIVMAGSYVGPADPRHTAPGWADQMVLASQRRILAKGFHVVSFRLETDGEDQVDALLRDPPRGLLLAEAAGQRGYLKQLAGRFRDAGVTVVAYGDDEDLAEFDRVASDHAAGAAQLTRWLIEQGRRRILMIDPPQRDSYWARQRRAGYEQALAAAGRPPLEPLLIPDVQPRELDLDKQFEIHSRLAAAYLMDWMTGSDPVDAVLCPSDGSTFPVMAACRLLGREPHGDVTVVGYDNYYAESPELRFEPCPPAATVDKRNDLIGKELVDVLLERIERPATDPPVCRMIRPKLLITEAPGGTSAGV